MRMIKRSSVKAEKKHTAIKMLVLVLIAFCIIGITFLLVCIFPDIDNCGAFSLETYSEELQTDGFMSDKEFDEIGDYLEAAKCAEILLKEDFSLTSSKLKKYRAYVYFDEESDAWLVFFTLKSIYVYNELSADYYVIISANGDVIARWGVK